MSRKYSSDSKDKELESYKKILFIYTGGTFGMTENKDTGKLEVKSSKTLESVLETIPELYDKEQIFLMNNGFFITKKVLGKRIYYKIHQLKKLIDSSDSTIEFVLEIKDAIMNNYHLFDGFLVIHGTDSLEYTGHCLSFLTKNVSKNIILTGSQIPLSLLKNDARQNLIGCLRIFTHFDIPGVNLYFNNHLFQANVCKKTNTT